MSGRREAFLSVLAAETARATGRATSLTLILLDADDFALVSARLGPARADTMLDDLARHLTACARPDDVVCRTGGDGLAVLLPAAGRAEAESLFARVRAGLHQSPAGDAPLDVSAGIAVARAHERPVELVARASAALRAAKRAGKGTAKAAP